MNKLYRSVVSLKYDIKEILIKLDRLENKAAENEARLSSSAEFRDVHELDSASLWNFPITSLEELQLFEDELLDKSFRLRIVIILIN